MSSKATKTILVTGGLGFIGSHTVLELLNKDLLKQHNFTYEIEPIIVDNLYNSSIKIKSILEEMTGKTLTFYNCDLCNKTDLENIFKRHKIDIVIHFAGYKSVNESIFYPLEYYQNNLVSSLNLVDLCLKYKVNNLIFSSSCTVYGTAAERAKEDMIELHPTNPYGKTKLFIENIFKDISNAHPEFKSCLLRYANPVSAHPSGKLGENPNPKSRNPNLFPILEQCIRKQREKVVIFGNDYNTRDGTCIRDYIHVTDISQAHVVALKCFDNEKLFENSSCVFNAGVIWDIPSKKL